MRMPPQPHALTAPRAALLAAVALALLTTRHVTPRDIVRAWKEHSATTGLTFSYSARPEFFQARTNHSPGVLREICPGPGEWVVHPRATTGHAWVRAPPPDVDGRPAAGDACANTMRRFRAGPLQHTPNARAPRNARVLLLGDSTMIRLWRELCDAWKTDWVSAAVGLDVCTLVHSEEYRINTDPGRKALDARGCCWRDYLRLEQPMARPHPGVPGLSADDVTRLPANLSNPMGHGKAADRRTCPTHGLDVEVR